MKSPVLQFSTLTFCVALALQLPLAAAAQAENEVQKRQTKTVSAGSSKNTSTAVPGQQKASAGQKLFSQAELDQMLAPVALYPDTVLSHVLIAATYPLEIVKATRWLSSQKGMTSEQALKAAENEPWDPSVRALVAFAPLLTKMNNELEWTQKLGDAFLVQQQQVMATVQSLREKAYAAGNLKDQEHITVQRREKEKVIIIEPRQREVVYVPVYDTRVVYGDWWWREYPPIHWPHPGYNNHGHHASIVYWGSGARVSTSFYFSTFYWPRREVVVINHYHRPNRYYRYDDIIRHEERRHWQHNPKHRHGVVYHTSYQPTREQSGNDYRQDDVGERRRWAAEQREQQNVTLPGDQHIPEQFPERERNPVTELNQVIEQSGNPQQQVNPDVPDDFDRLQRDREMMRERGDRPSVIERRPDTGSGAGVTEQQGETGQQPAELELLPMPRENNGIEQRHERPELGEGRGDRIPKFEQDPAPLPEPMPESINNGGSEPTIEQDSGFGTVLETPREPVNTMPELSREIPAEFERPEKNEIFRQPEPVDQQSEPVYQQPEPVYQQPEPVYQQPEPVYQQPEPVYQQPEPVYQQPEPVYQQPEPVYQQPEPVYQQPEPVYQQPEPVYQQPEPVYQQPEPVYQQPEPVYQQPQPVYQQPEPVYQQPEPVYQPQERPIESHQHIE